MEYFHKYEPLVPQVKMAALLSISVKSLIVLRKKGEIPYIPVGGKIMYQHSKVIDALTANV